MATIRHNIFTSKLSGMIGDTTVFKQVNGKPLSQTAPESHAAKVSRSGTTVSSSVKPRPSPMQRRAILRKGILLERPRKLKLPNAYTAAVKPYMGRGKNSR